MTEWKRNRRITSGYPKALQKGMAIEARVKDGRTIAGVVGSKFLAHHFGRNYQLNDAIVSYRILPSEPAAEPAKPDYSKGFPEGTTAKDIGAKVGDEFVVVCGDNRFKNGDVVKLAKDDGSDLPWFSFDGNFSELTKHCMYWHELTPIPQKAAIELQAEKVGIPEPVQHVDGEWIEWEGGECPVPKGTMVDVRYRDGKESFGVSAGEYGAKAQGSLKGRAATDWYVGVYDSAITAYRLHQPQEWPEDRINVIGQNGNDGLHYDVDTHLGVKRPDGNGWVKYSAGDVVDLDGVVSIDWRGLRYPGEVITADAPKELDFAPNEPHQIAWYRLNYGDASRHYTSEQQAAEADKRIDDAAQGVREAFGIALPTNKYQHTIKGVTVDVYDVLAAFGVTCQARGHAIKKLLMAGQRGHKDEAQDLREAVQAIDRSIELVGK